MQSSTVNDKDTYAFADMTHYPNASQFFGVQVCAVARKADVGIRSVGAVARSGSTEVTGSARVLDQSIWTGALLLQETDPAAASPNDWTRTSFNAAQFGVKVVA